MREKVITWRSLIIITAAFLVIFAIAMYGILSSRAAMEAQYAQQQENIVQMEQVVAALKSELRRVGTDDYVENEAREHYDYVRSGEILFSFANPALLENYTEAEWQIVLEEGLYPSY